ncbi:M-phase phosphoprotein 6-like [Cimex lectularius]|uniref:Uncharacterized protein n=1 Tax=Cimex lectularius TaxID=79782 RepID=A0A8I6TK43_CIMLE|nr:M-phase phosphoprotein 6-like [Cimex lectularius]
MQRSKLKAIAEQEAEEGEAMYGKNITAEMKNVVDKYIVEPSYVPIKKLIVGRVSYGGMNPEVEKLMTHKITGKKNMEISRQMDKDISDLEMAAHFKSNLANTMA